MFIMYKKESSPCDTPEQQYKDKWRLDFIAGGLMSKMMAAMMTQRHDGLGRKGDLGT